MKILSGFVRLSQALAPVPTSYGWYAITKAAWLAEHHDNPDLLSPELAEGVEKIISNSAED
jgi:hypothetical protein